MQLLSLFFALSVFGSFSAKAELFPVTPGSQPIKAFSLCKWTENFEGQPASFELRANRPGEGCPLNASMYINGDQAIDYCAAELKNPSASEAAVMKALGAGYRYFNYLNSEDYVFVALGANAKKSLVITSVNGHELAIRRAIPAVCK